MGIAAQLADVLAEIRAAAVAAGRDPGTVTLVAVSKTKPVEAVREAAAAGQVDFGENKVQEMVEKQAHLPHLRWHMIGTLQRNKVKYIAPFVHLIHSIDSERLLAEVDLRAAQNQHIISCLLQINISDELQKGGMTEEEAESILQRIAAYPHVRIEGLMGMAEFTDDAAVLRRQFRRLAQARLRMEAHAGPQVRMHELSMGMSGDFPVAIAEGATLVRVGSSIFGSR